MDQRRFRKLHRTIAPILFLPLLMSAVTGIGYRLSKSWFGLSGEKADFFMMLHQGKYLGDQLKPIYVLLLGVGLLGLIASGVIMVGFLQGSPGKPSVNPDRRFHRTLAPIIFLPLILSATTGILYRLGKSWFGLSSDQAEIFMMIHQGEYFGDVGKPIYVLLVGAGLLAMLFTGIRMTGIFRRRRGAA